MGKSAYTRKTTNPKMDWSEERKAKWSAQCKEAHANKTWYKKSKKAVGLAISNGKKEALKFKNRSEAMKKSWRKRKRLSERNEFNEKLSERISRPDKFFSATEIKKRINERKAEEQKAVMSHAPTTLSENLLDKAVLPEEVLNGVAEVALDIKEEDGKNEKISFPEPFETWDSDQKKEFAEMIAMVSQVFDQVELAFGQRPSLHGLLMTAVDARLKKIFSLLGSYSSSAKEEDE